MYRPKRRSLLAEVAAWLWPMVMLAFGAFVLSLLISEYHKADVQMTQALQAIER